LTHEFPYQDTGLPNSPRHPYAHGLDQLAENSADLYLT
jgi:hypothetical protein